MVSASKRILVLSDSLGATRHDEKSEGYYYDETYPFKLMSHSKIMCHHYCVRGGLSRNFTDKQIIFDYLEGFQPDIVILHYGINDAAPRIFPYYLNRVLRELSKRRILNFIIRNIIQYLSTKRHLITKLFKWVYTTPDKFKRNINYTIEQSKKLNSNPKVVFVGILMPSKILCERSYGFRNNVVLYNEIIRETIRLENGIYIDPNEFKGAIQNTDGIHLSRIGHQKLYEKLLSSL